MNHSLPPTGPVSGPGTSRALRVISPKRIGQSLRSFFEPSQPVEGAEKTEPAWAAALAHPFFKSEVLNAAMRGLGRHLGYLFLFSLCINILYLSSSVYMLQIYDRVIPGARTETLILITLLLALALLTLSGLDSVRSFILVRTGLKMDGEVSPKLLNAALSVRSAGSTAERAQAVRDFDSFRQFVTGAGVYAFLDAPWIPVYLLVIYELHPFLAAISVAGMIVIVLLALGTEAQTSAPLKKAGGSAQRSYGIVEESVRSRETVGALRMQLDLIRHWVRTRTEMMILQARASDRVAVLSAGTRFFRSLMQSSMLCFGAFLVIKHELTPGGMIAASIILGRALAPVEQAVGAWKQFVSARTAIMRVDRLLTSQPATAHATKLPTPTGALSLERVVYTAARELPPIIKGITAEIPAGDCVSLIGPSGAGKSTLAKLIVGALAPQGGVIRLDRADLANWNEEQLQGAIGYLPQDVFLFNGTIRENIARFADASDEEVVAAAMAANAHQLILSLPKAYETVITDGGLHLSGGQRQRIGLARAMFRNPVLLVLDEPNAHLDNEGDAALARTLEETKRRGATVILISHRPQTLALSDKLMIIREGQIEIFGPTQEVLAKFQKMREDAQAQQ